MHGLLNCSHILDRHDALTLTVDPTVAMALDFDNFGVSAEFSEQSTRH